MNARSVRLNFASATSVISVRVKVLSGSARRALLITDGVETASKG